MIATTFWMWLTEMRSGDVLQAIAVGLSPFIAIRLQKWWEGKRDENAARVRIFKDLMTTRAVLTAPARVNALNMIVCRT